MLTANSYVCNDLLEKVAYRTWNQMAQAGAKAVAKGDGMRYMPGLTRDVMTRVTPKEGRLLNYVERRGNQLAEAGRNRLQRMQVSPKEGMNQAWERYGKVDGDIRMQGRRDIDNFKRTVNNENAPEVVGKLRAKFPYVK